MIKEEKIIFFHFSFNIRRRERPQRRPKMKTKKERRINHGHGVTRRKKRLSYQNSVFSVVKILFLILTLAFIACDNGDKTQTKRRETPK
jgi:hypothetical protein